jgi:anti-anti-sigma factor
MGHHQASGSNTCGPRVEGGRSGDTPSSTTIRFALSDHRPPPDLMTTLERDGDATVLRVAGEVDLVNAHELAAALVAAAGEGERLVVDLREVPFMDSTGLRSIIETRERFEKDGRPPLRVRVEEGGPVARLLDLVGLRDLLTGG